MKYKLRFNTFDWACGDGCCSDYITEIFVNEKEITSHSFMRCQEQLKQIIEYINTTDKEHYLVKSIPKQVTYEDYEFHLFIDDLEIGYTDNENGIILRVLSAIGVKFTYYAYDFDWGKWFDEGIFEIEDNVEINKYNC